MTSTSIAAGAAGAAGGGVDAGRFTEQRVDVAGTQLYLLKGGSGRPLLVLHGEEGFEGWLGFHDALATNATVLVPSHPGYGHTPAPAWITGIPHQAVFYHWFLQQADLGEVDLVGSGIGGWIAAQMAVMDPSPLRRVVLVNAAGVRPEQSETLDIFVTPWAQVVEQAFHDVKSAAEYGRLYGETPPREVTAIRDAGRVMTTRMCYRPYLYDPSLPGMLGKVRTPVLVVWGEDNRVIPAECGAIYQRAIPGARLRTLEGCGHWAHLERPEALARVVREFLAG